MIDLSRQLRVEVAERIVGERGEMNDGVAAAEELELRLSHVGTRSRDTGGFVQRAVREVAGIHSHHDMPGALQHRSHHRADVPEMSREQDLHGDTVTSGIGTTNRPPHSRMPAICVVISCFRFHGRMRT